ncbi:hypothetical protein ABTY59_11365 [Streptomyces sp. NPDC096079]|uniref:hypothetical protein n=1 Tax=Streptomyces sp. NPDC096079 TaxID=3155820 RepID=UPI003323DFBC
MPDEPRDSDLGELLRGALSAERDSGSASGGGDVADPGEATALAAFRAARDAGLHGALPTRDLDDWTPGPVRRRSRLPLKAVLASLVASVTLGGVALAVGGLPEVFTGTPDPGEPRPGRSTTAPAPVPSTAGATVGEDAKATASRTPAPGTTAPSRPEKDPADLGGRSREALCRAFAKKDGRASKSVAWQRLVAAAGGEDLVPAYCRTDADAAGEPSVEPRPGKAGGRADPSARPGRGPERSRADGRP